MAMVVSGVVAANVSRHILAPEMYRREGDVQRFSSTHSPCSVMFFCDCSEGLLGQKIATVAAHQPGEFSKSLF